MLHFSEEFERNYQTDMYWYFYSTTFLTLQIIFQESTVILEKSQLHFGIQRK